MSEQNLFLKAIQKGAVLSLVRLIMGLGRVKVAAILLSTAGIGILAQANQFYIFMTAFGSLSLSGGLITRLSGFEQAGDKERQVKFLSVAFTMQMVVCGIILVAAAFGRDVFSDWLFGTSDYGTFLFMVAFAALLTVVSSGFLETLFFVSDRYDLYVRASLIHTILSSLLAIYFIYSFGIAGVFYGIISASILIFGLFFYFTREKIPSLRIFLPSWDAAIAKDLLKFGAAILGVTALASFTLLALRSFIVNKFGADANGWLHVPIALSGYYGALISNGIWGHLHPSLSRKGRHGSGVSELVDATRVVVKIQVLAALWLLAMQEILIRTFFSKAFLPAQSLMGCQLMGDLFYWMTFTIGIYFFSLAQRRIYLGLWVLHSAVWIIVTLALQNALMHMSVIFGYTLASAFTAGLSWMFLRKVLSAQQAQKIVLYALLGTAVIGLQWALKSYELSYFALAVAAVSSAVILRGYLEHKTL